MNRTDELKAKLDELAANIVTDPAELAKFSDAWSAGFRSYSFHNQILIWSQRPDATLCAGLKSWQTKHGRKVKKGSKAIYILAPVFQTITDPDRIDPETGNPKEFKRLVGFNSCYVFDISDTDGKPIDIGAGRYIVGTESEYPTEEAIKAFGLDLKWESAYVSHNGATDGRTVWLAQRSNPAAIFHTALHEIAHTILHCKKAKPGTDPDPATKITDAEKLTRSIAELEAEAVAYIVSGLFGIRSEKSAHYIGGWAGEKGTEEIKKAALRILSAAERIIRTFEKAGILKHKTGTDAQEAPQKAPEPKPAPTPAPEPVAAPEPIAAPPAAVIARAPEVEPVQGSLF